VQRRFVNRRAELALLGAQLEQARSGRPRIVLVEGPPGIGKSALLEQFLRGAEDVKVLRVAGEESEAVLPYGLVDQLVRVAAIVVPPDTDAEDLRVDTAEDHFTVGRRVLELLSSLEERGPLVVVVDDAHWADLPSLRALLFAVRRLVADRDWPWEDLRLDALLSLGRVEEATAILGPFENVKGHRDFPVGGQLISRWADSLCPCPRSADLPVV
jgi:hypothetical protein